MKSRFLRYSEIVLSERPLAHLASRKNEIASRWIALWRRGVRILPVFLRGRFGAAPVDADERNIVRVRCSGKGAHRSRSPRDDGTPSIGVDSGGGEVASMVAVGVATKGGSPVGLARDGNSVLVWRSMLLLKQVALCATVPAPLARNRERRSIGKPEKG